MTLATKRSRKFDAGPGWPGTAHTILVTKMALGAPYATTGTAWRFLVSEIKEDGDGSLDAFIQKHCDPDGLGGEFGIICEGVDGRGIKTMPSMSLSARPSCDKRPSPVTPPGIVTRLTYAEAGRILNLTAGVDHIEIMKDTPNVGFVCYGEYDVRVVASSGSISNFVRGFVATDGAGGSFLAKGYSADGSLLDVKPVFIEPTAVQRARSSELLEMAIVRLQPKFRNCKNCGAWAPYCPEATTPGWRPPPTFSNDVKFPCHRHPTGEGRLPSYGCYDSVPIPGKEV